MDLMTDKCLVCGNEEINKGWSTKNSKYCSFRCFTKHSVKDLFIWSSAFAIVLVPSLIGILFSAAPLGLITPFIIAIVMFPLPGYITGFFGIFYNIKDRIKKPSPEE